MRKKILLSAFSVSSVFLVSFLWTYVAYGDGKVIRPIRYMGVLEEEAQDAIIVFRPGTAEKKSQQDLVLQIRVRGDIKQFAWVVPLPEAPKTSKEDANLFKELKRYVRARLRSRIRKPTARSSPNKTAAASKKDKGVEVISREVVGSYEVSVVKEHQAGTLNKWLVKNGYQALKDAEDVLSFYRKQGYVMVCIKVSNAALKKDKGVDLHPLRFTFSPGGQDGMFFPMKLTGLQNATFNVNLYVFYDKWINDRLSPYGFVHQGFKRIWRDYDGSNCTPNAGKLWSAPQSDPYLRSWAHIFPTVQKYFKKHHPNRRFYLTNIFAANLKPQVVRKWKGDLWMFPYYTDSSVIPTDAQKGGPAHLAYAHLPHTKASSNSSTSTSNTSTAQEDEGWEIDWTVVSWVLGLLLVFGLGIAIGRKSSQ